MNYGKTQNKNNDVKIDVNSIFSQNLKSGNGYCYLPGGLIFQWGGNYSAGITVQQYSKTIPFPIAFPNECLNVQVSISDAGWGINSLSTGVGLTSRTKTGFTATIKDLRTTPNSEFYLYWFAIGY